jgi:hypothetical protein
MFTTDDSSGIGGTAIDAPPGKVIVVATVRFTNRTDRSEPFVVVPGGVLPAAIPQPVLGANTPLELVIPRSDATAFGLTDPSTVASDCSAGGAQDSGPRPPAGYCELPSEVGAFTPPQADITQAPQISPGSYGLLTLVATGDVVNGVWVPQNAPVHDVTVYTSDGSGCGSNPNCWHAIG